MTGIAAPPRHSAADVRNAVARARAGIGVLEPERRAELLRAAGHALGERAEEFALRITSEARIALRESAKEVARARGNLAVAAEEALRIRGETLPVGSGAARKLALTVREPVGVVAAITPFNRPLNQVVVKTAPAIAAGNAVVVKPSERTPLSAIAFAELLDELGAPPGLMTVVTGDPAEVGEALASDPGVDMVSFTGGIDSGYAVARAAAGKRVTLELGGNDPLIVLEDADLDFAARLAADQAFATAGQSCRGVKRVITLERVAGALVKRIAEHAEAKRVGDPFDSDVEIGPLIDEAAAERVEARCAAAVAAGAQIVAGGWRDGALHAPTVLDRVPPDAELVSQETFGPVAPVIRVRDDDEVIAVANSTAYGLQSGIVTDSVERFMRLAQRLQVGAVNLLDGPAYDSPHIPFGGVKQSGVGREGIRYAIAEMTSVKTITLPRPWT
jgi:acyl-CoA reductase-like NAD-dependent aldehyde dehydrogenase